MSDLKDKTYTQVFAFGEKAEDRFYCLIDQRINPDGLNIEEMAAVNPMRIEDYLHQQGCLIMIDGRDMQSISNRLDVEGEELHRLLLGLATNVKNS